MDLVELLFESGPHLPTLLAFGFLDSISAVHLVDENVALLVGTELLEHIWLHIASAARHNLFYY